MFCFCTLPHLRVPFIKAGIEGGAKLLAFEKPVALTSAELSAIRDLLKSSGAKAVVSHQHRYGKHYQKVKEIIAGGALGRVHTVYGTATGWMSHMLSHLIDYTCWFNDYAPASWAMAQAAGRAVAAECPRSLLARGGRLDGRQHLRDHHRGRGTLGHPADDQERGRGGQDELSLRGQRVQGLRGGLPARSEGGDPGGGREPSPKLWA